MPRKSTRPLHKQRIYKNWFTQNAEGNPVLTQQALEHIRSWHEADGDLKMRLGTGWARHVHTLEQWHKEHPEAVQR